MTVKPVTITVMISDIYSTKQISDQQHGTWGQHKYFSFHTFAKLWLYGNSKYPFNHRNK